MIFNININSLFHRFRKIHNDEEDKKDIEKYFKSSQFPFDL